MTYSFIEISDVHHGAKPHEEMREEFYAEGGFFDVLDAAVEDDDFIGVAICGDWFDKKLDMNDPRAKLAVSIVIDIASRLAARGKYMIVLRGTYTHDLHQLDVFRDLQLMMPNFRLVNHAEVVQFGPLKTLVIPEEYPADDEEYYRGFFSKKYDLILGHGFFDFNCFDANDAEKSLPKMPVFEADVVKKLAPITIFGHDHTHKNYEGKIWYAGSFSRLCHGEEAPKGFLYVEWDKKKPSVTFVENEAAPRYVTVVLDTIMRKSKKAVSFENIVEVVEATKAKLAAKDLKVKVTPEFAAEHTNFLELSKTYFSSREGYRFETGRLAPKRDGQEVDTENDGQEPTEFDFLFEPGQMLDKIVRFIEIKHPDSGLSRDDVSKALS